MFDYNDKSIPNLIREMIKEVVVETSAVDGSTRFVCVYDLKLGPFKSIQEKLGVVIPSDVYQWSKEWHSPRAICRELTRRLLATNSSALMDWLKYRGLCYGDLRDAINCTASPDEKLWCIMFGGAHHGDVIAPPHAKFPTYPLGSVEYYYEDLQPNLAYRGCLVPLANFHVRLVLHKSIPQEEPLSNLIHSLMKEYPRVRAAMDSGVVRYV